ncbi:MAG: hypothetical protein VCE91_09300, partial [Nitrospinota bacterium]
IPGRRVRYILTPKGLSEKSRKTMDYVQHSLNYYKEVRVKLQGLASDLQSKGVSRVALVGTGELAELFYLAMKQNNIEIAVVSSSENSGGSFLGYPVEPLEVLRDSGAEYVCVMELEKIEQCFGRLRVMGFPEEKILRSSDL